MAFGLKDLVGINLAKLTNCTINRTNKFNLR